MTVSNWSAIATAPLRAAPGFVPTVNVIWPFPFPLASPATAIQSARLATVHAQPVIDDTLTAICPPALATSAADRSNENRHGAPSCEISI